MSNGTQAKELALYFFSINSRKVTAKEISKNIAIVKQLMNKGYNAETIKSAIEHYTLVDPPKEGMYSLGYLHSVIEEFYTNEYMKKLRDEELKSLPKVGDTHGDNKAKYEKFNNQSWKRKKYNFDLFEKPE